MELTVQIKDQAKVDWFIHLLNGLDFVEISNKSITSEKPANPLLAIAGRFSSELSNSSKHAEETLMDGIDQQFSDQLDSLIDQYRPALEALAK